MFCAVADDMILMHGSAEHSHIIDKHKCVIDVYIFAQRSEYRNSVHFSCNRATSATLKCTGMSRRKQGWAMLPPSRKNNGKVDYRRLNNCTNSNVI